MNLEEVAGVIRTVAGEMREAVPTEADWHVESSAVARWHDTLLEAIRLKEPTCPGIRATHPQTDEERVAGITSLRCDQCDPRPYSTRFKEK